MLRNDESGAKKIINTIVALRNKNLSFFKNSFNYYFKQHKPFPNSAMYYDVEDNDFKFISVSQYKDVEQVSFRNYKADKEIYIKEHNFLYNNIEPQVIICQTNWMFEYINQINKHNFEDLRDQAAESFFSWYKVSVENENIKFKNILLNREDPINEFEIKKLF